VGNNCKVTNQITLKASQCLYGDGINSTAINVDSSFSSSALGVIVVSGPNDVNRGPCVHNLGMVFAQPGPVLTKAIEGTLVGRNTIRVASVTNINVGAYAVDMSANAIPSETKITKISGNILTLSANIAGSAVTINDTIVVSPARASFAPLGTCTATTGGPGCKYPPAIYDDVPRNRAFFWNLHIEGAWDGIFTAPIVPITFTSAPVANSTTATLSSNWTHPDGAHNVTFSDGEMRSVTLTNGAKTAKWADGLTNTVTTAAQAVVTSNTCVTMDNIEMGALDIGWNADGAQDFTHVNMWHGGPWGFQGGFHGPNTGNAWSDGTTIGWQIGRVDGLNADGIGFFHSRLVFTPNFQISGTPSELTNVMLDSYDSNLEVNASGTGKYTSLLITNLYSTDASFNAVTCPINITGGQVYILNADVTASGFATTPEVCLRDGMLKMTGGKFLQGNNTYVGFSQTGGTLDIEGVSIETLPILLLPVIKSTGGVTIVTGNTTYSSRQPATGPMLSIAADNALNLVADNNFGALTSTLPNEAWLGIYPASAGHAPSIAKGFGTNPSIGAGGRASSFSINVGTGEAASNGVITLPTSAHGWVCSVHDVTTPATNLTDQTASSTNSVTFTNYVRTTGVTGPWPARDILEASCWPN
jgi:hypothetical protein